MPRKESSAIYKNVEDIRQMKGKVIANFRKEQVKVGKSRTLRIRAEMASAWYKLICTDIYGGKLNFQKEHEK